MAWDCTLHVVDIASLARFSARFLRGMHRGAAFDQAYDADAMIGSVKQLIATEPDVGARALGELALLYASTETPHVYSRDFALSRWDDARMGAALPRKCLGTVETYLADVVAAYPKIAGKVPRWFDQHYCVGPVVAARDVPGLLAYVERVLAALPDAEQRRCRPLCDALRVAASRGLAYWEGADIDVIQTNEAWFAAVRPSPVVTAPSPLTTAHAQPLALSGDRMLIGEYFVLHEIDTASFPPLAITHPELQVTAAAFTPWGTELVRMVTDREARPFKFGYFELPDRSPLGIELDFAVGLARPAPDGVLLFPQATVQRRAGLAPMVLRPPCALEPLALPEAANPERLECDAYAFGDGSLLVIWDGVPYRWDGASPPTPLGGALAATDDVCGAVAVDDGSIIGAFGRALVRVDAEGAREVVLPLGDVRAVVRGPDDTLIVREGESPEGDVFKVWWPATGELTLVPAAALGLDERPCFVYYAAAAEMVVAALPQRWHALPWAELEAMRRITVDELIERRAGHDDDGAAPSPEG